LSKHERLDFASSSTCVLELAKTRGCLSKDGLDFANSSTCALELAEPRWGWLAKSGKTRFCQFEHATARIGRTEVEVVPRRGRRGGGWPDNSGEAKLRWWSDKSGKTEVEVAPRRGRCGGGWSDKSGEVRFCQFEHSCARICRIEATGSQPRAGTLGFANSSICMLEFAEPRWEVVGKGQERSVLPIRALVCSNLQN